MLFAVSTLYSCLHCEDNILLYINHMTFNPMTVVTINIKSNKHVINQHVCLFPHVYAVFLSIVLSKAMPDSSSK